MNTMIENLGKRMVVKAKMVNHYAKAWSVDERRFNESRELNKFDHELRGMIQAIEAMDMEFSMEYDANVVEITAIVIMGYRFNV